jgi:hypothetical protein
MSSITVTGSSGLWLTNLTTGNTSTNTLTINSGNSYISPGIVNIPSVWTNETDTLNVLGIDIDFEWVDDNRRITIALINHNGWQFWKHLKDTGFTFGEKIDEIIDNRVKILSRRDKLKKT